MLVAIRDYSLTRCRAYSVMSELLRSMRSRWQNPFSAPDLLEGEQAVLKCGLCCIVIVLHVVQSIELSHVCCFL